MSALPRESDAIAPVLVLKLTRNALHHGAVGLIRSLGKIGAPVFSVVEDRFTPGAVSKYLTGLFIWDTRGLDAQPLLEGMAMIGDRLGRPTIVIPTDDVGAVFIAEQAATLKRWFLFPEVPTTLPRTVADKKALYRLCERIGVACPKAVFPGSIDDVHAFVQHATFPIVAKAAASWLLPAGGRTTWIARTPEEAYQIYRALKTREADTNLIFQEYIPPADGEDWFYHGYRNGRSNCRVAFTGRKLRSYPAFAGPTSLGKAVVNETLRQHAELLLEAVSYSGIMDLDYRLDKRDGQYKLLDFNPRVGAQFRLFEDSAGIDVARALYLDLTDRRVPDSGTTEGRTFIADFNDLAASLEYFWRGRLAPGEWWRSLKGTREWAWWSRSDPLPFLMMCLRLLFRVLKRRFRMEPAAPKIAHRAPCYVKGLRQWVGGRTRRVVAGALRPHDLSQAGLGVVDQALVSLANFGLGVVVARLVAPTEFGAFGLAFATYLVALNIARGFATGPLMIRFSSRDAEEFAPAAAKATGLALLLGLLSGAICLILGLVFQPPLSGGFIGLAVALPGLLLQDALRHVLFTARRGRLAILNDLVWTVVLVPLIAIVVVSGNVSVFALVVCWGAGAAAAAIVGTLRTGLVPRMREAISWWREHWDITPGFLMSELIQMGGTQLVQFAIGGLVGLSAAGSLRGAEILLGPTSMLTMSVGLTMVPAASRLTGALPRLRRLAVRLSVVLGLAGAIWGAMLFFLPTAIGQQILGASWDGARSVLVPIILFSTLTLLSTGPKIALRALEDASRTLQVSTFGAAITVSSAVVGAFAAGVIGGAWGLAFGGLVSVVAWWLHFAGSMQHSAGQIHTEPDRPLPFVPELDLPGP
jgi:D-aspartate ligase